jgi:cytochrome P450
MINALGNDMDGTHNSYRTGNLVAQDPPRHTALRQAVRRTFAAQEILAKEDGLRAFARGLLADMRAKGGGDFASEFALPLSIGAATNLIGAPSSDNQMFQEHLLRSMERTIGQFGLPEDAERSNGEAEEHLAELVGHRIKEIESGAPTGGSDAITQIILNAQKGKVEQEEQVGLAHLVISAAIDAPAALLTNCVAVLDKYPALQGYLAKEPSMIKAFVEETLRYDTPGQNLCRQTTAELTIAGVTIPNDSRVMVLQASANRDERVFDNPDTFDITRVITPQNKIMSFGEGIHACMGAPLARLATRVAMETLLDGTELRIVGMPERWVKQMVRGFSKLPITFMN